MSKLHDQWVSMAIADDTLVAHQLLLLRNHQHSSVNPWACRQRRTTRFPVSAARASPTTPLTWTAATSLDGFEGSTRHTAPMQSSEHKPVDNKSATFAEKSKSSSSKKKRTLSHLRRVEQEKKDEVKNIRDKELWLRRSLEMGQSVEQNMEAKYSASNIAPQDHIVEKQSPDSEAAPVSEAAAAATAPSNERKSGGQQPRIFLPDLNEAPVEFFTEFIGFNQ
ncbi:hypothetical protein PHAVU_010G158800 [Phaseolus vulgaris]|uniref:Uncharacterized protein n=1 Tax=Phaseolus vulgaris TaxID=3885 RepID=V7AU93_PHAVU|nr:hypothetical protein PHAVU_010G158800g [Phaseolus vulgaris]ESW07786.1 hypothetical protein PHAVU_010G158800g [Phaseolus vulgaris]